MTPTARFVAGALIAIAGGALVIAASRLDWVVLRTAGEPVPISPDQTAYVGALVNPRTGHDVIPALLPLGVLAALSAGLALLAAARARRVALGVTVAAAASALGLTVARSVTGFWVVTVGAGTVHAGSARAVGIVGAAVGVVAGLLAMQAAPGARPLRLPE